jgi:hypothetical protein
VPGLELELVPGLGLGLELVPGQEQGLALLPGLRVPAQLQGAGVRAQRGQAGLLPPGLGPGPQLQVPRALAFRQPVRALAQEQEQLFPVPPVLPFALPVPVRARVRVRVLRVLEL